MDSGTLWLTLVLGVLGTTAISVVVTRVVNRREYMAKVDATAVATAASVLTMVNATLEDVRAQLVECEKREARLLAKISELEARVAELEKTQ